MGRPHSQRHTAQQTGFLWQEIGKTVSDEPDPEHRGVPLDTSFRYYRPYNYAYGKSDPALRPLAFDEPTPVTDYVRNKRAERRKAARRKQPPAAQPTVPPVSPIVYPLITAYTVKMDKRRQDVVSQYRRRQPVVEPVPEPWWLDPDELVSRNAAMIDDLLGDERKTVFSWPVSGN